MAPNVLPKPTFFSLPRELRDQIYSYLVIFPDPIYFHSTTDLAIKDRDTFAAPTLFRSRTSLPQLGQEVCETFYGCNTFELATTDLQGFLGGGVHNWMIHSDHNLSSYQLSPNLNFDIKLYVTEFKLYWSGGGDEALSTAAMNMRVLMECTHLRRVTFNLSFPLLPFQNQECNIEFQRLKDRIGKDLNFSYWGTVLPVTEKDLNQMYRFCDPEELATKSLRIG